MSAIFGESLIIEQHNGADLELTVWGDEFYVRYETKEGYTVCFDPSAGRYCYAEVHNGRFISTGASAEKPHPIGLLRHLQESPQVQKARFDLRFEQLRPSDLSSTAARGAAFTLAPNNGLLSGRRVSAGDIMGLTILVAFQDVDATVEAEDIDDLLNADNYSINGNFSSVRAYFQTVSNGKLNYRNHVVGPVTLPHNKRHYETTSIVPEAFEMAMAELESDGVDIARFDSKNEGIIDAVNFMYAGPTVYGINGDNDHPSELWPQNSVREMHYGDFKTNFYMLSSMGRARVDLSIGTFCHESGHLLCRFPDLYDYGRRDGDSSPSRGIGSYCLMGGGNHLNKGRTPSPVCAFLRDLVGWSDNEVFLDSAGEYAAQHGDYGTVMKYRTGLSNEYFLIENRSQSGLDAHLPSSGLAIYHCDIDGSNEWQDGTPNRHYQLALLQADGKRDLESNRESDAKDLFASIQGIALDHETIPSSRQWDNSDSGLIVSDISQPGNIMKFQVGEVITTTKVASGQAVAHLLIPDDDPVGIQSTISLAEVGTLKRISVTVDITHSWIGDLKVKLGAPSGKTLILHNRTGRSGDDIQKTYTLDNLAKLKGFTDEAISGDWILHVEDHEGQDTGRLNHWALAVNYQSGHQWIKEERQPNLDIPDASSIGISSTIAVKPQGTLSNILVQVDISHTYIGDLHVELVAPSGQSAVLHNRTGHSRHDLRITYDLDLAPALAVLIGESIRGDWTLRLRDLVRRDTGQLESWSLQLQY